MQADQPLLLELVLASTPELFELSLTCPLLKVLGEDLVLVQGQQERMLAGASVWANPVSYDKLGVRYRRWRNSLTSDCTAERRAARQDLVSMAAGEVFSLEQTT